MLHMLIMLCGNRVPPFIACYYLQNTKLTLWYLFQRHAHEQVKQALSSIICKTQALHLHHHHHIIAPISSPRVPFQSHASLTPLQCPPKEPMKPKVMILESPHLLGRLFAPNLGPPAARLCLTIISAAAAAARRSFCLERSRR